VEGGKWAGGVRGVGPAVVPSCPELPGTHRLPSSAAVPESTRLPARNAL